MASMAAGVKGAPRQAPENQGLPERGVPRMRAVALPVPPGLGAGALVVGAGEGVPVVGAGEGVKVAVLLIVTDFVTAAPVSPLSLIHI